MKIEYYYTHARVITENAEMAELTKQIEQSVKCPVCKKRLHDPKVLPCLHSFCLSPCLEQLHVGKDRNLECPVCHEKCLVPEGGVSKFQTNFTLQNIAELLEVCKEEPSNLHCGNGIDEDRAIGRCLQCEVYLCQSCLNIHKKQVATRAHTTVLLEEVKKGGEKTLHHPQICPVHEKEEIKLYCRKCNRVICRDCTLDEHRDHEFVFVKNIVPEIEKNIVDACKVLSLKEKEFQEHIAYIDKVLQDTAGQKTSNTKQIKALYDGYIKELQTQCDKLLATLKGEVASKEKQIIEEKSKVSMELNKLTSGVQFCQQLLNSGSDIQKAQMNFQVTDRQNNLKDVKWDRKAVFLTQWQLVGDNLEAFCRSQMVVASTSIKASSFTIEGGTAHCGTLGPCQFAIKLKEDTKSSCPPCPEFKVLVKLTIKGDEGDDKETTIPHTITRAGPDRWLVSYFVIARGRCDVSVMVNSEHVVGSPFNADIQKLSLGTCVQRGPSWKWGDQDGNGVGVVVDLDQMRRWVTVRWDTGHTNGYRWGADNAYDLQPVGSRK